MDDLMLEGLLVRAAAATSYPPTPSMRAGVMAAISAPKSAPPSVAWRPRLVAGALAIVALIFGMTLALPNSRSAIADLFGVEGTKVERLPTPLPGVTATPLATPGDPASVATPASLDEAAQRIGFEPALPPGAGAPANIFVATYAAESVAILRYGAYDLWEMRPRDISFGKGVPADVTLQETSVGGRPAYWIEGGPHVVYVFGVDGSQNTGELPGSERTVARDTLIWRTPFALYRLETTLTLADALEVAASLP